MVLPQTETVNDAPPCNAPKRSYNFLTVVCYTEEKVLHLTPEQERDRTYFMDKDVSHYVYI